MQIASCYDLHEGVGVRTTLNIDDMALDGAMKAAPGKTKTAVINEALREYARRRRIRRLLKFRGRVRWEGDLGELRERKSSVR
jgi:Arc/MetJ family transcription regulator